MSAGAEDGAGVRLRLLRLGKGASFVGIAATYLLILAAALVFHGWRPALLALFLVLTGQCFRHIAGEADRIGWRLDGGAGGADASVDAATRAYQKRMLWLFGALAQLPNAALVAQAAMLAGPALAAAAAAALLGVECLYLLVRRLNRRTAFREASYGFRERVPLGGAARLDAARGNRVAEAERALEALAELAADGRVSQRAYEKACDRYRVRAVMRAEAA